MEVLNGRVILRPADVPRAQAFYRDTLGLAVSREFGSAEHPGVVFYLGGGFLEVSGGSGPSTAGTTLWLQVRDVQAEREQLESGGVQIVRPPVREPWGLIEMWIEDPDGVRIVLVQVPEDHPLRRDVR